MMKLGELGKVSFRLLNLGQLGEFSFGMLKLGELSEFWTETFLRFSQHRDMMLRSKMNR